MKQTIDISDHLAAPIQQYLREHPNVTLSDLVQEALEQKLALSFPNNVSETNGIADPTTEQIEKFMALSGIVKQAPLHSDEHAEDYVD